MKTAISIPDELFEHAEQAAKNMGIPRSQLFAMALEEFISRHTKHQITEQLNKVYSKTHENSPSDISVNLLRETLKDDSW